MAAAAKTNGAWPLPSDSGPPAREAALTWEHQKANADEEKLLEGDKFNFLFLF